MGVTGAALAPARAPAAEETPSPRRRVGSGVLGIDVIAALPEWDLECSELAMPAPALPRITRATGRCPESRDVGAAVGATGIARTARRPSFGVNVG